MRRQAPLTKRSVLWQNNLLFTEKTKKYSELAKACNISFVPLIFLDTGKAHRAAAKFMKWLCYVAIPGSRCQKNKSIAIGNAWIGRFSFLIQKQNALTIQHSITNARQKEMRNGSHVKHGYSNEFLDSDRVVNVYFTSDVDAKSRISSLNDFYRINLNDVKKRGEFSSDQDLSRYRSILLLIF